MASAGARARSKYLHNESKDGDYKDDGELSCEVVPEGVRSKVGHSKVAEPAVWERVDDPSVGMPYYVNKATGESRWEPPEGLSDFVAVPLPPGVEVVLFPNSGGPPKPTMFALAHSALAAKNALLHRKHKIVEQIRVEFLQFEQAQQEELRKEIARLEALLNAEQEQEKSDIHSVLTSLQGLSNMFVKKKDTEIAAINPQEKMRILWTEYEGELDHLKATLVADRDRQKQKLKERLAKLKADKIREKVDEVQRRLALRKAHDTARIAHVESQFAAMMVAREVCTKAARKRLQSITAKSLAGAPTPHPSLATSSAWLGGEETTEGPSGDDNEPSKTAEEPSKVPGPPPPIVWMQLFDGDGNPYYYNGETGESSWERPPGPVLDAQGAELEPVTEQVVTSAEKLAVEWVSQDVLDYERSITAQLESRVKELTKNLTEARESSATDTLKMLEELMTEPEKTVDEEMEDINKSYEVDRRRLSATLVRERNRQRSSLQARLKDRRSALEAETQAAAGQLKLRRQASEKMKAETQEAAATVRKRRFFPE